MNRNRILFSTVLLFSIACAQTIFAGPLEDARALLAAGKPGQVDAKLGALLEAAKPSRDVLLVSFDAALAAGKLYTAERRALAIMESPGEPPAKFLADAAEVAGLLGKDSIRRDRLMYLAKVEKNATPLAKKALASLLWDGAEAELFARYVKQFGPDADSLELGMRNLRRLRETGKADEYVKQVDVILGTWKGSAELEAVFVDMSSAVRDMGGLSRDSLSDVIIKNKVVDPSFLYKWTHVVGWGKNFVREEYLLMLQEKILPEFLTSERFAEAVNIGAIPQDRRDAFAKRVWALVPAALQSTNTWYARRIGEIAETNPGNFFAAENPVAPPATCITLVRKMMEGQKSFEGYWSDRVRGIWSKSGWSTADKVALIRDYPGLIHHDSIVEEMSGSIISNKNVALLKDAIYSKGGGRGIMHRAMFPTTTTLGDKSQIAESWRAVNRENGNDIDLASQLLNCQALTMAERVGLLREAFQKTGYNESWKRFAENTGMPNRDTPEMQAFLGEIKPGAAGNNAFEANAAALRWMRYKQPNSQPPDGVHEVAAKAFGGFQGKYPGTDVNLNANFESVANHYLGLSRNSPEACKEYLKVVSPKIGKGAGKAMWDNLIAAANTSGEVAPRKMVAKLHEAIEGDILEFAVTEEKDSKEAFYAPYYAKLSAPFVANYVSRNLDVWAPEAAVRELTTVLGVIELGKLDPGLANRLLEWADSKSRGVGEAAPVLAPEKLPLEKMTVDLFDNWKGTDYQRELLLRIYVSVKKRDVGAQRYIAGALKQSPMARQRALSRILEWGQVVPNSPYLAREVASEELTSPLTVLGVLNKEWAEAASAGACANAMHVPQRALAHIYNLTDNLKDEIAASKKGSEIYAANSRAMRLMGAGGYPYGNIWDFRYISLRTISQALEQGDFRSLPMLSRAAVRAYHGSAQGDYLRTLQAMADAGAWESVYMVAGQIDMENKNSDPQFARWRSEASSRLPGVYPVSENDPSFPLYVAADELIGNRNPERAWMLLQRNIAIFEKDPLRYPPQFTAWAVEQLRHSRGSKDELLNKAKSMIDKMLAKEAELSPDLAANLMLTRAEIARDTRQFDRAHLEYQSIRNHPVYQKTEAGRQAMFRDVDLLVTMGNSEGAQETIEQWLTMPDTTIQAQAHYMLARIAFEREDYEETRKQLDKVFELDFTHTEARLLHGKWKLATNYEIDETQVLVGTLSDRSLIRPGQPLAITVQDRNLGVAGGGASIPILITTSKGGDAEILPLYPSARDPSLFRGTIDTVLSAATPSNGLLNVRGNETVTYNVEPGFLRARGLRSSDPKNLQIVDDASMAVGAALPDAKEGGAEAELEVLLSGGSLDADERMLSQNLRPGNPIYVAVRDRDRSITEGQDEVKVLISTSSGDALRGVSLTETAPFSGIFRASVPTFLPAPLASASDSASGVNPGDVINRKRKGTWRSLPDGEPRKWIDVDTMGSHLVSVATLDAPNPADITHLRLHGRLAEGEQLIGEFPENREANRGGIIEKSDPNRLNDSGLIRRNMFKSTSAPVALDNWDARIDGTGQNQSFFVSGTICPPEPVRLRMKLQPLLGEVKGPYAAAGAGEENFSVRWSGFVTARKDGAHKFFFASDDGARVWVGDKQVVDQWVGRGETDSVFELNMKAGQLVPIRIEYFQSTGKGSAKFAWIEPEGSRQLVPRECLSVDKEGIESGLLGEYFRGQEVKGTPFLKRVDDRVDFGAWPLGVFKVKLNDAAALAEMRSKAARENLLLREAWVEVLLDGYPIISGSGTTLLNEIGDMYLEAGPHSLEVFASGRSNNDSFRLVMEQDNGQYAPLPAQWSDPKQNEVLSDFLSDRAKVERTATGFKAAFETPVRLRAIRWEFVDFAGMEVQVSGLGLVDSDGKEIIPVDSDYSDSLENTTLEVAPGDRIRISYEDEFTSRGDKRLVERWLSSSFHDAEVQFVFESVLMSPGGNYQKDYFEAYRVRPGDSFFLRVTDPDMDLRPGVDEVEVAISAGGRPSVKMRAVEVLDEKVQNRRQQGYAGGVFYVMVNTVDAADAAAVAANPKALPLKPGEMVTAKFFDRENTMPGIPIEREACVLVAGPADPEFVFYNTWLESIEDDDDRAQLRLLQIQRRPGNENIDKILKDVYHARPMTPEELPAEGPVVVNASVPVPISVYDPSRARHEGSMIVVEAVTATELEAAASEGRDAESVELNLTLERLPAEIHLDSEAERDAMGTQRFNGLLRLRLGEGEQRDYLEMYNAAAKGPIELRINGNDKIRLRVIGEDGKPQEERWLELVSAARLRLMDSTYMADRNAVHLGDRFHISVEDPDRNVSATQDVVRVEIKAMTGGASRSVNLNETMPHSGRFSGSIRPVYSPDGKLPEDAADESFPVAYGDTVVFSYDDQTTLPFMTPGRVSVDGEVYKGSDGGVRMFSKRFRDSEQAVSVQFRMAESLFENAKELRKLGENERSANAISAGRETLETALRDYPGTEHAVEGEYLLGNLYQELATEEKDAGKPDEARVLYEEALARFTGILATWPGSEYAPRAQYHKALCLEMLGDYNRASEEYVKMTYLYPSSPLVGDATVRLATYYYTQEQRYDTAGRIYENFQKRFPSHERAAASLFMGAQCHIKQAEKLWGDDFGKEGSRMPRESAEEYKAAVASFDKLIQEYPGGTDDERALRAQSMYWAGDASFRTGDYKNAYLYFKRNVFEYPETEWARRSRGMLCLESKAFESLENL